MLNRRSKTVSFPFKSLFSSAFSNPEASTMNLNSKGKSFGYPTKAPWSGRDSESVGLAVVEAIRNEEASLMAENRVVFVNRASFFTATEIELSEYYTCVITHGPKKKITHIFDDLIIIEGCSETGFCSLREIKKLSADHFLCRGEMAFCSQGCRKGEICCQEERKNNSNSNSAAF